MAQGVSKILTEGIKHRSTPLGVIAASTLAARRGGIAPAVKASARTNAAAAASVSGSGAVMPSTIRVCRGPMQTAAGMPRARHRSPSTRHSPSTTSRLIAAGEAPTATRRAASTATATATWLRVADGPPNGVRNERGICGRCYLNRWVGNGVRPLARAAASEFRHSFKDVSPI